MYGFLFNILREMVIGEYGEHYWKEICHKSGVPDMEGEVLAKEMYDDSQMKTLIAATADVLGIETEPLLELFGEQYFRNIKHSGHYKVVSCLGNTLEGFLLNLDTLHDHITLAYPKMKAISFRAEKTQTGLLLHYFSTRQGLYPMVIGIVKTIAKEFYNLQVDIELVEEVEEEGAPLPYHYKLSIEMVEGKRTGRALGRLRGNSIIPDIDSLPQSPSEQPNTAPAFLEPSSPIMSPQMPHHIHQREERSQSTGQILRERSGPVFSSLTPSTIAQLTRLCPHNLTDVSEEDELEESDESDPDRTPMPQRRSSLSPPSPSESPIQHQLALPEMDSHIMMRRGSSHSSLTGGLPASLLPALPIATPRLPLSTPRTDSPSSTVMSNVDTTWPVTKSLFQICFPFHIIFDINLTVRHMGISMSRLLPEAIVREDKITDHFTLLRPIGTFNYQTIRCSIHNPFILAMKPSSDQKDGEKKALQFRGQMVPVINSESCPILFIGSPRIETVEDLQLKGLYLTDLPLHDVTRDLIMLSHHFKAEVNVAFQLEVTKRELEIEKKKVQEEKQRADNLLHAMLPPSVTRELTSSGGHEQVVAEEVPMVTILFSDIRDFTTICHRCAPMDVVSMLNDLYTKFDSYIDRHKVYKVETIGDAYMVAAGLLDTSPQHAEAVTNMAFDMRQAASLVTTPHTNESIKIRIGIHSGQVVAGVVGTKMPRYCLFGDTVNTASRMESHGEAGHVHISQMTYKRLRGRPYVFWNRGRIRVKGLPEPQQTYFVEPGENHELSETVHIVVAAEKDSDSEWEDTQDNAFQRKQRLPSFVRYKHMKVVSTTTQSQSVTNSQSSVLSEDLSLRSRKHSSVVSPLRPPSSPRQTMKERLAGKLSRGSIGSISLSQGLSNFMEHDEGTYREMGIDLPSAHLTVETVDHDRKLSVGSGMLIKVEPEGQSVTFTRERISSSSSSPSARASNTEDDEGGEEGDVDEDDLGIQINVTGSSGAVTVKSKKHKHRTSSKHHKNKCKIS